MSLIFMQTIILMQKMVEHIFKIKVISSFFKGKSKVEKHRIMHRILDYELKNGLHALTLELTDIE